MRLSFVLLPLAFVAAAACGGKVVVDEPAVTGTGGSVSTLDADCEKIAAHVFGLGCVPSAEEQAASCMNITSCPTEYTAWTHCFATHLDEVTGCSAPQSAPPSCQAAYCTVCQCGAGASGCVDLGCPLPD